MSATVPPPLPADACREHHELPTGVPMPGAEFGTMPLQMGFATHPDAFKALLGDFLSRQA